MDNCMKPIVINMIERGHGNKDIIQAVGCSSSYVRMRRAEYNKAAPVRKPSRFSQPQLGTDSRVVYDYYKANPGAEPIDAHRATGINRGTCSKVRSRYLFYTRPECKPFRLNEVNASELEVI